MSCDPSPLWPSFCVGILTHARIVSACADANTVNDEQGTALNEADGRSFIVPFSQPLFHRRRQPPWHSYIDGHAAFHSRAIPPLQPSRARGSC